MGFETGDRKAVAPLLLHKYGELRTIADIAEVAPEADSKKAFQKQDRQLEQQVGSADRLASDPAVGALAGQLHLDHLTLRDPIQAAYFQDVILKYGDDLRRIAGGEAPQHTLETRELQTFLALTGDRLCKEEAHMLRMLEPLMTPPQRETYRDARALDWKLEENSVSSADLARLALKMYAPYTPVMGAAALGGYGLITGDALSIALITAMSGGFTVGEHLQKKAISERKGTYGVNFLEDPNVANELLRLHERAAKPVPEPDELARRLEGDVALFGALLQMHGPDASGLTAHFDAYLRAAEAAKAQLDALTEQSGGATLDPVVVKKEVGEPLAQARAALLAAVDPKQLKDVAVGIRPDRVLSEDQLRKSINRLVAINVHETLSLVNAPLSHSIDCIEAELGIERYLDTRDAPRLDQASIDALKVMVGKEPSLPELMGVARLAFAGAIDLKDLWPNLDHPLLPGQQKLDARALVHDIGSLGFDDHAKWLETFGKLLKGPLAQGLGVGGLSAVILLTDLAFFPFGFVAGFGPRLLGAYLGNKAEQKALEMRATKGIEYVRGRPNATEYEVLLDWYADPKKFLEASPAELKALCAQEAGVIRKVVEGLEAIMPLLGEKDLADYQAFQKPVYDALTAFADRLEALGTGDPKKAAEGFRTAWSHLFSADIQRTVQTDILRQASVDDFVADPRARWVNARIKLLRAIKQLLDGGAGMSFPDFVSAWKNSRLRNDEFVQLAKAVKELGDDFDRSQLKTWQMIAAGIPIIGKRVVKSHSLDEIETFAAHVLAERWEPTNLSDLVKIYESYQEHETRLDTELREHWPVDEKRAVAIAQEMLDVLWRRVHPLIGNADPGEEAPKFHGTAEIKGTHFVVTGEIGGGKKGERGRLEIEVDPYGLVDLGSVKNLDLGTGVLKDFAAAAVEKAIAGVEVKRVELLGGGGGEDYRFVVHSRAGDAYAIHVSPDGFPKLDTLGAVA